MKMKNGIDLKKVLIKVNDRKLYGQSWFERKVSRFKLKRANESWRQLEINTYGMSLYGINDNGSFVWL
jgi:hypothetical protein